MEKRESLACFKLALKFKEKKVLEAGVCVCVCVCGVCVCVCVCVREREREREGVCFCVHACVWPVTETKTSF